MKTSCGRGSLVCVPSSRVRRRARGASFLLACGASLLLACVSDASPGARQPDGGRDPGQREDGGRADGGPEQPAAAPGTKVTPTRPAADDLAFSALSQQAQAAAKLDLAGFRAAYPTKFTPALSYDANNAQFMDRIQASALALSDGERAVLGQKGFVISTRREFPTFVRGFAELYSEHLPLYITADALLESVHSSYDTILESVERSMIIPELRKLLTGMRSRLPSIETDKRTRAEADLYLTVALSLLDNKVVTPVAGADLAEVQNLVKLAKAHAGTAKVSLFGSTRDEDFSQFTVRGHYTDDAPNGSGVLASYFRAQMWLGRVDLRLLETQPDGTQLFRRSQFLTTLLFDELVGEDRASFTRIDEALQIFIGESDYMVLSEVPKLVADLGGLQAARSASDDVVASAIVTGGYGKQQIASHLAVNGGVVDTLPLNCSFALLGQRYVVDSHVFSEVVYDRLTQRRMMPSPLDAAFAALGNAQAATLQPDLESFTELPGALARVRVLVDSHGEEFWNKSFYNLWLSALRALSPAQDLTVAAAAGLPQVATTEAWGRRLLNAQLGSWAELRHNTVLYAKQSYTGAPVCEYPDAYVDPYPAFYRALGAYAAAGIRIADAVRPVDASLAQKIDGYYGLLASASATFADMAERQLRGEPHTEAQLAFVNEAVRIEKQTQGCTTIEIPDGWYADLFFNPNESIVFDPTIADVHTQPTDEGGAPVGKVLHVGTGYPRLLVTTVDTCMGPRAYAGVVYAYHEEVTTNYERLTDPQWAARFREPSTRPADVSWLSDVLAK